ncbi:hydantoinase/oxoprolinase family protein [Hyphomicrobium sp. D-2]|uniref:hydantoinase/oxoprolinase family protein n=1 Tax=Hyphomicrobium sp. D-2 TaxID=3041621 RepID=UPI002453CBDA|nr:hydantoinase/oxoprolinase family protein [Hyphomicrobium sp. D-2]MDH4981096.1 hydantoinase/oxoprolinase family protein [Hyphomicrobium sp. D-2]
MSITAGYDVGGAHLKVALAENGRTVAVRQIPCPLWQGLAALDDAFASARDLTERAQQHALTMTGELCEAFPDRVTGVAAILDRMVRLTAQAPLRIWIGPRGMGSPEQARAHPLDVASTNFLASAALAGRQVANALIVDMGSTTTDIIPVVGGIPVPRGLSDGERLRSGELVYSGTTRTDVSCAAKRAQLDGITQRLAAGNFANMADVRRVLDTLPDDVDQHPTLDGRGKSQPESLERFARCFGRDAAEFSADIWRLSAAEIAAQQMDDIADAIQHVLATSKLPADAAIIAAGVGAFEIAALAQRLNRQHLSFADIANADESCRDWATRCAPAVAVALLA